MPDMAPKTETPTSMRKIATVRPPTVTGVTSPYPTVVIVAADHQSASPAVRIDEHLASNSNARTARELSIQEAKDRKVTMKATEIVRASATSSPRISVAFSTRRTWMRRNARQAWPLMPMLFGMHDIKSSPITKTFLSTAFALMHSQGTRERLSRKRGATCRSRKSPKNSAQTMVSPRRITICNAWASGLNRPSGVGGSSHSTTFSVSTRTAKLPRKIS
mmetsp:Transcript_74743/g.211454  ORF Transcript_74743/g.211454 Transcript_74743/m.211454 type:complete len:219 (-) Transcript_74743:172-828(-)